MTTLSNRQQLAIGCILVALMLATRGHHFPTVRHMLPSASWAVFFLAGIYVRPILGLGVLMSLAAFLDYAATTWGGVSSFCISPAYIALLPAYTALWLAGRWYRGKHTFKPVTLMWLAIAALAGTAVCQLISSGSFYFFSGRFADPTLVGMMERSAIYFPRVLSSMAFWVGTAAVTHALVVMVGHRPARSA